MQLTAPTKTALIWLVVALAAIVLIAQLGAVLTPFVVAAVLAYVLNPLVNRLHRLLKTKIPRLLCVIVVEILFLLSAVSIALLIVPILVKEIPLLREQLPALAERFNLWAVPWLKNFGVNFTLDVASIKEFVLKYLSSNAENSFAALLSSLKLGGSVALTLIGNAILIPVALFYLLQDWEGFIQKILSLIPKRLRNSYDSFMSETDAVLGQYLRGQLLVMLTLTIYYSIFLALCGLDLALPIGVFTGLAIFVPYVGFGIGLVLGLLAAVLQFSLTKALIVIAVVYGIGQLIEGFFLTPRLVGERIGLHPLAVIFALLAFGQLFGFIGVLIALPASAVLLVALRRLQSQYLASDVYLR